MAQTLVATLSERIRSGAIPPGSKLPTESEFVRTEGVSRTVVREAISHLQASGLVETRHGIGTFVLEPPVEGGLHIDLGSVLTGQDVLAILELRISLETETSALAAVRRSDAQLEAMRGALAAFQQALERGESAIAPDIQFHLLIAQATGNPYFYEILHHLGTKMIPRARINANAATPEPERRDRYLERVRQEHENIYGAIARREPDAARAAMRTHLSNSRERLRRAIEAAATQAPA